MVLSLSFGLWRSQADIPAPDSLVYGSILLNGQSIGAKDTNVVIEARRSLAGAPLASYRMGTEAAAGDFYFFKLPLEEISPTTNPQASLVGQSVFVVVRDQTGDRANLPFKIADRGSVTRLDFGTTVVVPADSDQDGLSDAWELAHLGTLNYGAADDPNHTGSSLLAAYTAGTDPKQPDDQFELTVTDASPDVAVSFLTRLATGAGYDGLSRHYALYSSTNLLAGSWVGVPNLTNIVADGTVFQHKEAGPDHPIFFRAKVWLQQGP